MDREHWTGFRGEWYSGTTMTVRGVMFSVKKSLSLLGLMGLSHHTNFSTVLVYLFYRLWNFHEFSFFMLGFKG